MKVLLLQLPVQTHDFFFSNENIPLAPAYLKVIASGMGIEAALMPSHLMRYGSDQALLKFIVDAKPDLVGMSCYLWNIDRSLFLCREIKCHHPECKVILGGPEITPDNHFLLQHRGFDMGVVGEGEGVWRSLLQSYPKISNIPGLILPDKRKGWHFNRHKMGGVSLTHWSSPYLQGALDFHLQGALYLETVRGCVFRCAYCCYHKQSRSLRTFPVERVLREVQRAWEKGLEEVVFLDPCFTRRPNIEALLDGIAAINHDRRLRLHAESTVEGIDARFAEKMAGAGFTKIETGLQSVSQKTLRKIHRSFRPRTFLKGVHSLQNQGIDVMVDLIAGLPGDSLSDVCKSMDWVMEQEAYDYLMLYPLSLISSTELKQRATELGLVSMPDPPYLLTQSPGLTAQEMCHAFRYYEEGMEEDISLLEMPLAIHARSEASKYLNGLLNVMNWHTFEQVRALESIGDRAAYALTIRVTGKILRRPDRWFRILKDYLKQNPFTLLSVEVPSDALPEDLDPLWQLAREHQHPADRDYTVTHTPYRSLFVFSRGKGLVWKWPDPRESFPLNLHDGQKVDCRPVCLVMSSEKRIPLWFLNHIRRRYPCPPEFKLWQIPDE